jgi:hypothetical protein
VGDRVPRSGVAAGDQGVRAGWAAHTRRPTRRSATVWTCCTAPPGRPRGYCRPATRAGRPWPHCGPRRRRGRQERRRWWLGDALTCNVVGVEVRGFEPLASSVRASWGERHAHLHLRSSRRTVRAKLGGVTKATLLVGASADPATGPILTMDRQPSAVLSPCCRRSCASVHGQDMDSVADRLTACGLPARAARSAIQPSGETRSR